MVCMVCGNDSVVQKLDVGAHPVSTFYLKEKRDIEFNHSLRLGQCENCATIQLMEPVRHNDLISPYDWIFSREPEEHLDEAVDKLMSLPGIGPDSTIAGLSYKDDSTVERFRKFGFNRLWRVDLKEDLGAENPTANIETVQKYATPERLNRVAQKRGQVDLLIVRHIIEHAENLSDFMNGCAELVKTGGYIMVECPDCMRNLTLADFAMVWEEHSIYFTPETFEFVLSTVGFETVNLDNYPLPFENCLVLVARKTGEKGALFVSEAAKSQRELLAQYSAQYETISMKLRDYLRKYRDEIGPIAVFGAGHLACAFILFHGLTEFIDCIVDDTPQKQGLYLPGARLPILPSKALLDRNIKLCLFAVSPNSEDRIEDLNNEFTSRGGEFGSVLAASKRSIRAKI